MQSLEPATALPEPLQADLRETVEALGLAPRLVPGDADNFKLTWPEDFARAERVLRCRENPSMTATTRLGEGWDIHALVPGRALVLGGVTIPHATGVFTR